MHCVDLGESFPTHIYLQNFASIQPRTSPLKSARPLAFMQQPAFVGALCLHEGAEPRVLVLLRDGHAGESASLPVLRLAGRRAGLELSLGVTSQAALYRLEFLRIVLRFVSL